MRLPAAITAVVLVTAAPFAATSLTLLAATTSGGPNATATVEIPAALLAHYQHNATCPGITWSTLAAIGWIETRHATGHLDPITGQHTGRKLHGLTAVGSDTDHGALDGDPTVDWATGLMQLTPATWTANATTSSDRVGRAPDIDNAYDQIATANHYLCTLVHDRAGDLAGALADYNCGPGRDPSCGTSYASQVLAKAAAYTTTSNATVGIDATGDVGIVIATAVAQIGKPYVFGTQGPDTFDCSGLVTYAYRRIGIELPAYTFSLLRYGTPVPVDQIQPGDLLFTRGGVPTEDFGHVAIAITTTQEVVAPRTGQTVTITPIHPERIQAIRRIIQRNDNTPASTAPPQAT